ncbi:MAG: hypothetical protein NT147_01250 [Candidatus Aminicenantes bacterium]|nr:hypothetical protein [Candidatus Aminicenantes bacterium]
MKIRKMFGGMIRGVLVVGLTWLLALSQGLQAAGRTSGAKVGLVTGSGSERFTGELIGVRTEAIVLETEQGETRTVAIKDISSVRVYRRSAVVPGILGGLLAGSAVGYGLSASEYKDEWMGGLAILFYSGIGAVVGGAIGGVTAGGLSADKTYELTTMSAADVDKFMAKLRKMARVKNYQ